MMSEGVFAKWFPFTMATRRWFRGQSLRSWCRWGSLTTLVAIVWQVENWRGRERWAKVEEAMAGRGQSLDPWDYLGASDRVPDEQNAMRHPVWDAAQREEGPDLLFFNPEPVFDAACEGLPQSLREKKIHPNLEHWHQILQREETEDLGQDAAEAVLEATRAYAAFSEGMDEAFQRPYAKWFRRPTQILFANPVPQIPDFTRQIVSLASVSQARAVAHLSKGHSDRAAEDLLAPFYLLKSRPNDWGLVMLLVRINLFTLLSEDLETVLAHESWKAEDLQRIQTVLGSLDQVTDLHRVFQVECAAGVEGIGLMVSQPENFYGSEMGFGQELKCFLMKHAIPQGWVYQNMANKIEWSYEDYVQCYDPERKRLLASKMVQQNRFSSLNPYTFLAMAVHPSIANIYQSAAKAQTRSDLLSTYCALQRFHLTEGTYPSSLDVLVPRFMKALPHDYVTGRAPSYKRTETNSPVLTALDWNQSGDPAKFLCRVSVD